MSKITFERLPRNILPHFYFLRLEPNFDDFTFIGEVTIDLNVIEDTNFIKMNAGNDLDILQAEMNGEILKYSFDKELETVTFQPRDTVGFLKKGSKPKLLIKFKGEINDKMIGLYRSAYPEPLPFQGENPKNHEKFCAVTQFEATEARKCFPCFDEPNIKSYFQVELSIEKSLMALSNTPVEREIIIESTGRKKITFQKTPCPMSTYLLAFYIGQTDYIETFTTETKNKIRVRVYTPPGNGQKGMYALNTAVRALEFYEKYFRVPYPLQKYDLLTIHDSGCHAMENWGLVTFIASHILVDDTTPKDQLVEINRIITHETGHQWFGNLVTMDWWTHLWLNEGHVWRRHGFAQ